MRKDIILHFGTLAILLFLELLGFFSDYHQGNFARILVLAAYGIGNNVLFAKSIGLTKGIPFLDWQGIDTGLRFNVEMDRSNLLKKIEKTLKNKIHIAPGGPAKIKKLGIITGGAGTHVDAVAQEGIDTFITGEGQHHTFTMAEELGVNLIYAGHYATETFGVTSLANHLAKKYKLKKQFIHHPTGL